VKELFEKMTVHPKVSLWITIVCLLFVLANNKLYLVSLSDREKNLHEAELRVELRERALQKRELTMTLWERELVAREREVSALLKSPVTRTRRLDETPGSSTP
jgi:hypothetical protein